MRAQQSTEVVSAAQEQIPQRKALRNDKLSGLGMTVAGKAGLSQRSRRAYGKAETQRHGSVQRKSRFLSAKALRNDKSCPPRNDKSSAITNDRSSE